MKIRLLTKCSKEIMENRLPKNPTHPRMSSKQFMKDIKERDPFILSGLPYNVYLQTDHWLRLRERVIKRAKGRCERCHTITIPIDMQVHHFTYLYRGCERMKDLAGWCEECHEEEHRGGHGYERKGK